MPLSLKTDLAAAEREACQPADRGKGERGGDEGGKWGLLREAVKWESLKLLW